MQAHQMNPIFNADGKVCEVKYDQNCTAVSAEDLVKEAILFGLTLEAETKECHSTQIVDSCKCGELHTYKVFWNI